jgi:O-antigen ligase
VQIGIWFAAVFTLSAGLGGMILSLGIWFWAIFRANKKPLFSKIVIASAIIFAVLVFSSTLISPDTKNTAQEFSLPFSDKKIEASVRVLVWENSLDNFREFPFVGKGTGTNTASLQYATLSGDHQILLDAHNIWLNVLGQTGLLGFVAFVSLIIFLITRCRFCFDKLSERNLIHLALSCAFVGAFLYQGLSGSYEDARHLWVLFGLLVGISTFSANDTSVASREP